MRNFKWSIFFLVIVAFILRVVPFPTALPPSLNWDETSLGYNAYSLLKTGRDEWGEPFPMILRAFGDYKLPVYAYFDALPVALFGLNEFSVRLPSLVCGTLLVAVGYVLARTLKLGPVGSTWSAILIAFSPWTWFLSKVAIEANLALLLVTLGITLLIRGRSALGILFLGLSVWTYNSARIFAPLFLLCYFFAYRKKIRLKTAVLCLLPIFLLFVPMFIQLFSPAGQARYRWLSLIDKGTIGTIEQLRNSSSLPSQINRLLYNRLVYFARKLASNYLSHFTPDFLFTRGGTHYQFSVPGHGLMYLITLPLFYLGLILASVRNATRPVFIWLFLAALPGSLVKDAPHPLRAIFFSVPAMIFVALAVAKIHSFLPSRTIHGLLLLGFIWSLLTYVSLHPSYSANYSWSWQYGYRQVVDYIRTRYSGYDEIIFTKRYGEPHIFVLFFWQWDPKAYFNDPNLVRYARSSWYWVDGFDKFRFVNDWDMKEQADLLSPGKKYLIISSPENPPRAKQLLTVNFLDGKPAFLIQEK